MAVSDDKLIELIGSNAELIAAFRRWSDGQIMLLAGTVDDPDSFDAAGGKAGALGYYPVVNVSGQTIYVPCLARLQAMAAGGADPAALEALLATQVGAARAAADEAKAASLVVSRIADARPSGYGPRTGVTWALVDAAKRALRLIDRAGVSWSYLPERFLRDVEFRAGASMGGQRLTGLGDPQAATDAVRMSWVAAQLAGKLDRGGGALAGPLSMTGYRLTDLAAPAAPADPVRFADVGHVVSQLPPGYSARSGVVWAILDRKRRALRYIDPQGTGWSHVPERFQRPVRFAARTTLVEVERSGSVTRYPTGYDRSPWVSAMTDSARRVLFGLHRGGSVWGFGRRLAFADEVAAAVPPVGYIPAALLPTAGVAEIYGDSLMAGANGGGTTPGGAMAAAIGGGFVANNNAIGGQKITQIAMRMGALAIKLTVAGNTAPAAGGTLSITGINGSAPGQQATAQVPEYRFLSTPASAGTRTMAGFLCGQPVTVRRSVVSGDEIYELVLGANNPAFSIPPGSVFVPAAVSTLRDREIWLDGGINDLYDAGAKERILATYDLIVRFARPTVKRLIIFGLYPGNYTGEKMGAAYWTLIREINDELRQRYPQHFAVDDKGRDLHRMLMDFYDPASPADVADYAADVLPSSMRSDPRHGNGLMYGRWGAWGAAVRSYLYK